ncbi:serine/threonine-protein kinase [Streptomyces sp. NPDC101151]|uniref:serine/threonine-protein kinase n=1 Tax=Streptomyces sp. NPDC101151 TaxID=3366115 RepID=UPI00380C3F5C
MEPGRVLGGRYRLISLVGSGRHGRVWRAYDEVRREVTVEEVGEAGAVGTARVAGTLRAAAALRGHPSVVAVKDVVEADGVVWAVVPVVSGPSLADLLAEDGRLPVVQVWEVASAMLGALEAIHRIGVVHGDVQPANIRSYQAHWILLPKIGALAGADTQTTRDDMESAAEADYIAPELLHGARRSPSSDLFSLGATLYHLVAGIAPFHRDSVMATLSAVEREEPPPLGRIGGLGALIEGLLDKDPERRLTVAEARRALGGAGGKPHVADIAGAVRPAPTTANHAPGVARWGLISVVLSAVLTVALALARARVGAADVVDFFVTVLPWAVFVLGVCVLAVQARAALARRRAPEVRLWRWYLRSLAPPARWNGQERDRRRAAAERAVDEALLTVDRRVAAASPDWGRGTTDV